MADMKDRAKDQGFENIPYVLDKNHELADAFGAKTTPHVFLFNADMELVYKGAIDDNVDSADSVGATWLKDALENCASGKDIDPNTTKAVGCSIKLV